MSFKLLNCSSRFQLILLYFIYNSLIRSWFSNATMTFTSNQSFQIVCDKSIFNRSPFIRQSNLEQWMHCFFFALFICRCIYTFISITHHFQVRFFRLNNVKDIFRSVSVANFTFICFSSLFSLSHTNAECVYILSSFAKWKSIKLDIDFIVSSWDSSLWYFSKSFCTAQMK